jgi:glycosyltransferase involved in cell wall biosynthesis
MMRVAFILIGGESWTGGKNYVFNLVRAITVYLPSEVVPVLFVSAHEREDELADYRALTGVEIVRTPILNRSRRGRSLAAAIVLGQDHAIAELLTLRCIDVLFESAMFFGRRLPVPVVAWLPDFQHRTLPSLFSKWGYWKRELGFRAQVVAGRTIMVSSEDSRRSCELYYPATIGRTFAVRFAVPPGPETTATQARAVADSYGLPATFFYMPNQFWQHKNHVLVIEALALLRDQGLSVVVAASGKQYDARKPRHFSLLKSRVRAMRLESQFRMLGMIPYGHIGSLMQASVCLINPSLSEGWSTTVEEAKSLGVPMVLSDLAVHREQVGESCTYFDPHDAASLALALRSFAPISAEERDLLMRSARTAALDRVRRFAHEFAQLMRQCKSNAGADSASTLHRNSQDVVGDHRQ